MQLELWQSGRLISSVTLPYFQIAQRKQGYSATVIPGLDHSYKLSMTGGGAVSPDWIIEFSDPIFGNRWKRDEIDLAVVGRNCPYPVHSQHDRRYIWSGEHYLTVRGRGACTSFPDMPSVDCRTQPKLSSVEHCPSKCPTGCTNGFCDCASGECLCNAGYAGVDCRIDTCAAARCVNGNCAARYLGRDLLVTRKPCVCSEGWYGDRCDTNVRPPPVAEPEPACLNGCYFHPDTDISSGNLAVIQTSDPKTCCAACQENPACTAWVVAVICFLKSGTQRVHKPGTISGIKCSSTTGATTVAPLLNQCDARCKGQYPHGCNDGYDYGYCNVGGGCAYAQNNDPSWCCFKGCTQQSMTTVAPVVTTAAATGSCDGRCRGAYPFGCNPSFSSGYCNSGGGCSYSAVNHPDWCCFKGC